MIQLLVLIVVLGLVWYLVVTYLPLPAPAKTVINVICILFLIIILLQAFGLIGGPAFPFKLR